MSGMSGKKKAVRSKSICFSFIHISAQPFFYQSLLNVDLRKAALTVCLYNVQAGVQSNHLAG